MFPIRAARTMASASEGSMTPSEACAVASARSTLSHDSMQESSPKSSAWTGSPAFRQRREKGAAYDIVSPFAIE